MTAKNEDPVADRLRSARLWARQGAGLALDAFREIEPEWKGEQEELVTESDRSVESHLRTKIGQRFPEDTVVGEEFETTSGTNEFCWYLDPIDGTASYSMALPIWTVSVGIYREGRPVAGVLMIPFMDEEFYGSHGYGPCKDGRKLDVGPTDPDDWTSESLLCITSDAHRSFSIDFPGKCRSLGSSAYYMGLVLDGRAVGALLGRLRIWDVAGALGFASATDFVLVTLDGQDPGLDKLNEGEKSEEPLIFTHKDLIEEFSRRIEPK